MSKEKTGLETSDGSTKKLSLIMTLTWLCIIKYDIATKLRILTILFT